MNENWREMFEQFYSVSRENGDTAELWAQEFENIWESDEDVDINGELREEVARNLLDQIHAEMFNEIRNETTDIWTTTSTEEADKPLRTEEDEYLYRLGLGDE